MRNPILRRARIAWVAALFTTAPAVFAATGFLHPAAADRLEPGTVVELLWNLDNLPSDAEESELVLSLDGGRTFPVRVTGDFDPATRRILWRVPALPTNQARLALRTGADEEPAQETLQIVSPTFVISGSAPEPALEELFAVGAEWRTRDAFETEPRRSTGTGLRGISDEQIHANPDRQVAAQGAARVALLPDRLPAAPASASTTAPQPAADPVFDPRRCPTPLRE